MFIDIRVASMEEIQPRPRVRTVFLYGYENGGNRTENHLITGSSRGGALKKALSSPSSGLETFSWNCKVGCKPGIIWEVRRFHGGRTSGQAATRACAPGGSSDCGGQPQAQMCTFQLWFWRSHQSHTHPAQTPWRSIRLGSY